MGAADVVPGVSGGTMAFILGIYEELIRGIRSFDGELVRLLLKLNFRGASNHVPWRFLGSLAAGILTAIFTLAHLIAWLLENRPVLIWSFFFGLVLASVIAVTGHVPKWRFRYVLALALSAAGAFLLVGLTPQTTPDTLPFLFVSASIAICAMILPGISGSFILVLLGKYQYVLQAVNDRNFLVLLVFSLGAATGLILFSRLLNWLLTRRHDLTIAILVGFMLGSLRKVWPWKDGGGGNVWPADFGPETLAALGLLATAIALVLLISWLARPETLK
jgi:putative membrane protein